MWAAFWLFSIPQMLWCSDPEPPVQLPTTFRNHLIFLTPETKSGGRLNFLTDTGGGTFIYRDVAEALNLIESKNSQSVKDLPLKQGSILPLPSAGGGGFPLFSKPSEQQHEWTGLLGSFWHADRIWLIDYRAENMFWLSQIPEDLTGYHQVNLGFQRGEDNAKTSHFPTIEVEIDGQTLKLLFDTGAQAKLSDDAAGVLGYSESEAVATSFIVEEVFQSWRRNHPSWRVIEGGDRGAGGRAMIEVPQIRIGNFSVGPSWFATRPNSAFREYMAQWMDGPLDGAVGGSVFKYFKLVLDYPRDKAYFFKFPDAGRE